jgi:surface carbohydrate biosynthesis protein
MRIVLIVDNPLRDIDGIVLVAWHLAQRGHTVYLTPMYDQGFDVLALSPDLVVANYARTNNIDMLRRFFNAGISVAILDTEGSPGCDMGDFARMVGQTGVGDFVSLYCLWGPEQYEAFTSHNFMPVSKLCVTGCPRYDFSVYPLRKMLSSLVLDKRFILINTSFPIANPRFTNGSAEELKTMIRVGYDKKFAINFVNDMGLAFKVVKDSIKNLVESFPDVHFVLRPHPFENPQPYCSDIKSSNFEVRQEGTSLDWINKADFLIHLNCLTSIESLMLNVESISCEWANTKILKSLAPPYNVSFQANSYEELVESVKVMLEGGKLKVNEETLNHRQKIIKDRYYKIDGKSAGRIVSAIELALGGSNRTSKVKVKFNLRQALMQYMGYKSFHFFIKMLRRLMQLPSNKERIKSKLFSINMVREKVAAISSAYEDDLEIKVAMPNNSELARPHLFSRNTIKIFKGECFEFNNSDSR